MKTAEDQKNSFTRQRCQDNRVLHTERCTENAAETPTDEDPRRLKQLYDVKM